MSRKLIVEIIGDDRSLNRALGRSSTALTGFQRNVEGVSVATGKLDKLSALKGLGAGLIASEGVRQLRAFVEEAQNAEVILGQTRVAVEAAGLSWDQSSRTIEDAAQRISRASSFDDERVLQSFQQFVRTQRDAGKAMDLVALSADVARGRYISLEAGVAIVNKASLGMTGQLRRLGIELDKNATSTEALAALQAKYAGASEEYSSSSAAGFDRLNKSISDAKELIGGALLPVVDNLAEKLEIAVQAGTKLGEALSAAGNLSLGPLGKVKDVLVDIAKYTGPQAAFFGGKAAFDALFGGDGGPSAASVAQNAAARAFQDQFGNPLIPRGQGQGGAQAPASVLTQFQKPLVNIPLGFENAILKARNENDRGALTKILVKTRQQQEQQLQRALDVGDTKAVNEIRGNIESLQGQIAGIYSEISADNKRVTDAAADAAERAKQRTKDAAKAAAERLKEAADERGNKAAAAIADLSDSVAAAVGSAADAIADMAEKVKQRTTDFRSALLDELQRSQEKADVGRDVRDARENLRIALQTGGKIGIRNAREGLDDALRSQAAFLVEGAQITQGPRGGFKVQTEGAINFTISGVQDPERVAELVIAKLGRKAKRTAPTFQGRLPGVSPATARNG